jgi:hypothetical protein
VYSLPGEDLVVVGIADLAAGLETVPSLLVSIGAPRLRALGVDVPVGFSEPEHRLFRRLAEESSDAAHSKYNALLRRLVSYERSLACGR